MQGTGIILEGKLLCIDCVKGGKKRSAASGIDTKTLVIAGVGFAAVLGGVAVFLPGQVLLTVLVLGIVFCLAGILGFTMSSTARLGTVAAGLAAITLSGWGMMTLREKAQAKASTVAAVNDASEIQHDLDSDHIMEAKQKIGAIEQKALVSGNGMISPIEQKRIATLKQQMEDWTRKNYGELSKPEHGLLFRLMGEFGSVTTKSARKFRAVKIDGDRVSVTIAVDPNDLQLLGVDANDKEMIKKMDQQGMRQRGSIMTGLPALDKAATVALFMTRNVETLNTLEMKIVVSQPGGEAQDFQTVVLDSKVINDLKAGDPNSFRAAFDAAMGTNKSTPANSSSTGQQ